MTRAAPAVSARLALALLAAALLSGASLGVASAGTAPETLTCEIPTSKSGAFGITKDPSGNVWFVEEVASKVARLDMTTCSFTEIALPVNSYPVALTLGPDGNMWVTERGTGKVARVPLTATKFSEVTEFSAPGVEWISPGPESSLWLTLSNYSEGAKIARMTTGGVIAHEYPVSAADPGGKFLTWIATGPEGDLWFTDYTTSVVGKMTSTGTATGYKLPSGSNPGGIVEGADHNMWLTEESSNKIARVTPAGKITEFAVPTGGSQPEYITRSSGGNLYFSEFHGNKIGRVTPDGTITEIPLPEGDSGPEGIADPEFGIGGWIVATINDSNKVLAVAIKTLEELFDPKAIARKWKDTESMLRGYERDQLSNDRIAIHALTPEGSSGLPEELITKAIERFSHQPEGQLKGALAVVTAEAASNGVVEAYSGKQADDPPRSDYWRFAHAAATAPKLPPSITDHAPGAIVRAANALLGNTAKYRATAAAMLTTFERVRGAYAAGQPAAEQAQGALAATLAGREAALTAAEAGLLARLSRAAAHVARGARLSARVVRRLGKVKGVGFTPALRRLMGQLGLTKAEIAALAKERPTTSGAVSFHASIDPPALNASLRAAAAALKSFASALKTASTP